MRRRHCRKIENMRRANMAAYFIDCLAGVTGVRTTRSGVPRRENVLSAEENQHRENLRSEKV